MKAQELFELIYEDKGTEEIAVHPQQGEVRIAPVFIFLSNKALCDMEVTKITPYCKKAEKLLNIYLG